jgi:hypothetical protein
MSLIDASVKPKFDPTMRRYDDWDLWMTLDKKGHKGVFLNKVILKTYNRPQGISSGNDSKYWLEKLHKKHGIDPKAKIADIIIPHHNRHDHLKNCLDGIDNKLFNIIIVSGGTFAENCNKGARLAETDTLIFLNDDVETKNEALMDLANTDFDLCGISQYIGSVKYFGIGWTPTKDTKKGWFLADKENKKFIPSGYCMKFKKQAWEKLNGLNEKYRNGGEDIDIGLRAMKKKMTVGFIDCPMMHHHSQSDGRFNYAFENEKLLAETWTYETLKNMQNKLT